MRTYKQKDLAEYLKNDWIRNMMQENYDPEEESIRTQQWMVEMDNKRLIYADVYGDILKERTSRKILDVGGGYNALTKVLAKNSQYTLLDFIAHGEIGNLADKYRVHWLDSDWYSNHDLEEYDLIIANDIFPDVDQRLEPFIDRMLPHCKELRLVLTYYNREPCFYTTRRLDDTEILTFLSWNGEMTGMTLKKFLCRSDATEADLIEMEKTTDSIYWNGRQVSYVKLKGDL